MQKTKTSRHIEPTGDVTETIAELLVDDQDCLLCHAKPHGYFIRKSFYQMRRGARRIWEDISPDEMEDAVTKAGVGSPQKLIEAGTLRVISTEQAVTLDQGMRLFMNGWEDGSGFFDAIRSAFDRADVTALERGR